MKNFKQLKLTSLVLLVAIFTISCSSDDDGGPSGPTVSNDLYGTWSLNYYQEDGTLVNQIECEEDIEYRFVSDQTYSKTTFSENENSNCETALIINGDWEIIDEENILLMPSSSTQPEENINFNLINEGEELEIFRSGNRLEVYNKQ
ncbi:lipocalin family protein [Psychroflexus aestuariivivens]|uniref:lipocalin family protein n=1 Tax=Psychroflexus aestuariivivens TaxID=1795040 RepID=UPI000FD8ECC4|nr:lipocalin family protein [Psychroflexus aestuariivivens]